VRAVIIMIAAQLATVVSGSGDSMPARATGT
jgi:hypothetical protein